MADPDAGLLTLKQCAEHMQSTYETMLLHVHLGNLPASDISAGTSVRHKPIWRVRRVDLDAFVESRRWQPPDRPQRVRFARDSVIEFF